MANEDKKDFAYNKGLECIEMKADWSKFGKAAGPIRNADMADKADVLLAFRYKLSETNKPSKGTENMIKLALDRGLEIHIIPINR